MAYQNLRCPKGHSFSAYVTSRYAKVECPACKAAASAIDNPTYSTYSDFAYAPSQMETAPWQPAPESSSSAPFSSGDGGDYGGGGASSSWDSSSSSSDSSSFLSSDSSSSSSSD